MKRFYSIFTLAICCLFFSNDLKAQDSDYGVVVVEYMKVKPGMMDEYRECEQAWKLIHQARLEAGYITGWQLERVMYPSGTNAEYDFLVITNYKNWNAINAEDSKSFTAFFKALPADKAAIADKAEEYRDLVKREIWAAEDMFFAPGATKPKYRVENFMNIPADGWEKWYDMEMNFAKPFLKKSMEMGNRAGWLIGNMVFPRGDELSYQASTIDFYNTWEDMAKSDAEAWDAIYGDMEDEEIGKRINSTRTIVRSELRVLVDSVE